MEVHPPEHGVHSWRDVFVHLGVITLGLLIALTLESLVEMWHRHHLMVETRASLQEEFEINKKYLDTDIKSYRLLRRAMENNVRVLLLLKQHQPLPATLPGQMPNKLFWRAGWEPFTEAEWHTANQTTGLSLMKHHEVAQYAESYTEADEVNKAWDTAGHHIFDLGGYEHVDPDPTHLMPQQVDELLQGTGVVLAQLQVVALELMNWADSNHVDTKGFNRTEIMAGK